MAREIVALLNGGGGVLWIGAVETNGELTGFEWLSPEDSKHIASLKDVLVDRIEPRLRFKDDCLIGMIGPEPHVVLAIVVNPDRDAGPYCFTDGENRKFLIRVADRTRSMHRSEIFREKSPESDPILAFEEHWDRSQMLALDGAGQPPRKSWYRLALLLDPSPSGDLEFSDAQVRLVDDPPEDVARRHAGSFHTTWRPDSARFDRAVIRTGSYDDGLKVLRVEANGWLEFATRLEHLQWIVPPEVRDLDPPPEGVIFPLILVEMTVSLVRLASRIFSETGRGRRVAARLELANARNWMLPPYAPYDIRYGRIQQWRPLDRDEATSRTIVVEWARFQSAPDTHAFALLRDVYREFALPEDAIPFFPGGPSRFVHSLR